MIDISAIAEQLNTMKSDPVKPKEVDPLAQFANGEVVYQPDGSYASIKGADGSVLYVAPDGNYWVVFK